MERATHKIDASGKVLGRLATKIAILLRGKYKPDFQLNRDMGDFVIIQNINQIRFTGKKIKEKKYYHHSGFPGGIKEISLKKLFAENPNKVLKMAVFGMLPKNKLRVEQIKRLKIEN